MTIPTVVAGRGAGARAVWETLRRCDEYDVIGPVHPVSGTPGSPGAAGQEPDQRSWTELLALPDVSLLALCAPFAGRMDLIVSARDASKAVLLAEPPFLSLDEIDFLATCEDSDTIRTFAPMPLRMLLSGVPELSSDAWSGSACGALTLSCFTPARRKQSSAAHAGTDLPATTLALAPYVDLMCHLFGAPVVARLVASGDGTATGFAQFASGAFLSMAVTLNAPWDRHRLEIIDVARSIVLDGRQLRVDTVDEVRLLELPSPQDLRVTAYRDIATQLTSGGPLGLHRPGAGRGLALFLDLLAKGDEAPARR
ncbi:hypothetical protein OG788_24795 [Streptomyces sp. NBC_00647]|uniref:hypothetical protein n=1 Tax=Streptomyces sp. NBC_00647 TaxID=2975796 RepID=UPI0032460E6E